MNLEGLSIEWQRHSWTVELLSADGALENLIHYETEVVMRFKSLATTNYKPYIKKQTIIVNMYNCIINKTHHACKTRFTMKSNIVMRMRILKGSETIG